MKIIKTQSKMIELMANNIRCIQNSRCGKDEAETQIISYFKDKALADLENPSIGDKTSPVMKELE